MVIIKETRTLSWQYVSQQIVELGCLPRSCAPSAARNRPPSLKNPQGGNNAYSPKKLWLMLLTWRHRLSSKQPFARTGTKRWACTEHGFGATSREQGLPLKALTSGGIKMFGLAPRWPTASAQNGGCPGIVEELALSRSKPVHLIVVHVLRSTQFAPSCLYKNRQSGCQDPDDSGLLCQNYPAGCTQIQVGSETSSIRRTKSPLARRPV